MWKPVAMAATVVAVCATTASAQATQQPPPATATVATTEETRPATTTPMGDTGLWFVRRRLGCVVLAVAGIRFFSVAPFIRQTHPIPRLTHLPTGFSIKRYATPKRTSMAQSACKSL